MTSTPTITADVPGHGQHKVTSDALDASIAKYLPASPAQLREIVEERTGLDYAQVREVSTFLVILADFDHNSDGDPLALSSYAPGARVHSAIYNALFD